MFSTQTLTSPQAQQLYAGMRMVAGRFEKVIADAVAAAVSGVNGFNPRISVEATMKDTSQGTVKVTASWFQADRGRVLGTAEAQISRNVLVDEARDTAKLVMASAKPVETAAVVPVAKPGYTVDATKLRAKRIGDGVVMTHPDLQEWSMRASLASLKANRADVEAGIAVSIQGFCATQFERNADIVGTVKMPAITVDAPKSAPVVAKLDDIGNGEVSATVKASLAAQAPPVVIVRTATAAAVEAASQASQEYGNSKSIVAVCAGLAGDAAMKWIRGSEFVKIRGSASGMAATGDPRLERVDTAGLKVVPFGIEGSALVVLNFVSSLGREQATIEVPFDKAGKVVVAGVARTKADLAAAEDIRSKLAITSEAERAETYRRFVERETGRDIRLGEIRANADGTPGVISNRHGNMDRTPILKNSLPEEYSVEGKLILLSGMVYRLDATSYNSVSNERGAHWMLCQQPDTPASKADYALSFGFGTAIGV